MRRFLERIVIPLLVGAGAVALVVAVGYGAWALVDSASAPAPAGTPPAVSSDPNGSVVTYEVNGRTIACVVIDPPGAALAMSCDFTREAVK